jgi:hypothetical protein
LKINGTAPSSLNLIVSAIILWNTVYIGHTVCHLRDRGIDVPDPLLSLTPVSLRSLDQIAEIRSMVLTPRHHGPSRLHFSVFSIRAKLTFSVTGDC